MVKFYHTTSVDALTPALDKMLIWQTLFIISGVALLPFAPALYALGRYTRWKVGVLPAAAGELEGSAGDAAGESELLVIGESTAAGLGAATHEQALAGQFARQLAERLATGVNWTVVAKSGVTAERTLRELVPQIPTDKRFDYILVAIGGNDVLKLSSPRRWRQSMRLLLGELRRLNPDAAIFITNCPMINASPVIPQPIKGILWQLSRLHDANIRELAAASPGFSIIISRTASTPKAFLPTASTLRNKATPTGQRR